MGMNWHNWWNELSEEQLDLLHREAENVLSPQEKEALVALENQPSVKAARQAFKKTTQVLTECTVTMPRSVTDTVLEDISFSKVLQPPSLSQSVSQEVLSDVQTSQFLQEAPQMPKSVAADVVGDIETTQLLSAPQMPESVVTAVLSDMQTSKKIQDTWPMIPKTVSWSVLADMERHNAPKAPLPSTLASMHALQGERVSQDLAKKNTAPTYLVGGLLVGLVLMMVTAAWPNLAAGALVFQTLLGQVSPLAGWGLLILLLTSAVITWRPHVPVIRYTGTLAYATSAMLTIPALYNAVGGQNGLHFGRDVTVNSTVKGNVIAIGGDIKLQEGAKVSGEVVTLLGDVHRHKNAKVTGQVSTLLGDAPGDKSARKTQPTNALGVATAAAFRPVMGWLGAAAWPQIFVLLTGAVLLLLFILGVAPVLASYQRHAPLKTLSLGILMLSVFIIPTMILVLMGHVGLAFITAICTALLIAMGLSVSVYDVGRTLAYRVRLPLPDAVGALLGLSTLAASMSYPPLSFTLAVIGGVWGAGTLFLTQRDYRQSLVLMKESATESSK